MRYHGLTLEQAVPLLPARLGSGEQVSGWMSPAPNGEPQRQADVSCALESVCLSSRAQDHRQVVMGLPEQGASPAGKLGHQGVLGDSHSTPLGELIQSQISNSEHTSEACKAL